MRRRTLLALLLSAGANVAGHGEAQADVPSAKVGAPAPAFVVKDSDGRTLSSAGLLGRTVVLEWTNPECPFVDKHYSTGNMQALQREALAAGVTWLMISSAAPGNVGYLDGLEGAEMLAKRKASATHLLLDHDGRMMAAYGVNVALTMAVIDDKGVLAYYGAIDDKPTAKPSDVTGARNFVREALAALASGQRLKPALTRPYGCAAR